MATDVVAKDDAPRVDVNDDAHLFEAARHKHMESDAAVCGGIFLSFSFSQSMDYGVAGLWWHTWEGSFRLKSKLMR